ncbi:MAG: GNAT family N-acetyltransferase, partial [Hydrogenophaga sp.]|nr:GNAT family N-acetyltransferase [Hydrogenophaga sp.]
TSLFLHGRRLGKLSLNYNIRTKKAYVRDIRIEEQYRNNGLGTKLLQEVSKDLGVLGCTEVELLALTDQKNQKDLPRLTRFYQKCGFLPDPKNTFFTAGLTMRKTLTKRKQYEKN